MIFFWPIFDALSFWIWTCSPKKAQSINISKSFWSSFIQTLINNSLTFFAFYVYSHVENMSFFVLSNGWPLEFSDKCGLILVIIINLTSSSGNMFFTFKKLYHEAKCVSLRNSISYTIIIHLSGVSMGKVQTNVSIPLTYWLFYNIWVFPFQFSLPPLFHFIPPVRLKEE